MAYGCCCFYLQTFLFHSKRADSSIINNKYGAFHVTYTPSQLTYMNTAALSIYPFWALVDVNSCQGFENAELLHIQDNNEL